MLAVFYRALRGSDSCLKVKGHHNFFIECFSIFLKYRTPTGCLRKLVQKKETNVPADTADMVSGQMCCQIDATLCISHLIPPDNSEPGASCACWWTLFGCHLHDLSICFFYYRDTQAVLSKTKRAEHLYRATGDQSPIESGSH